jgi:hypothetical protein
MDASIISALAALGGAAIGGLTSVIGAWLTQQAQVTAHELAEDKLRRQELYKEFVEDASKAYADALQHNNTNLPAMVALYTKISRMRVLSSPKVVANAEHVARTIIDTFMAPSLNLSELGEMVDKRRLDPLRAFAEACRAEFLGGVAPIEVQLVPRNEWLSFVPHRRRRPYAELPDLTALNSSPRHDLDTSKVDGVAVSKNSHLGEGDEKAAV